MSPGLFKKFYDPVNSVICVDGCANIKDIHARTLEDHLHFPLFLDEVTSLSSQIDSQPYASRSFRYGSFGDNVLGMNFKVNGNIFKLGGRTIKNVSGYDLVRFICNSSCRFGEIETLVLKLRPLPQGYIRWLIEGNLEQLNKFVGEFIHDTWSNLATAADLEMLKDSARVYIEIPLLHDREEQIFTDWMINRTRALNLELSRIEKFPACEVKPQVRVKTKLSDVIKSADKILKVFPGRIYCYLGNGFFQFWPESNVDIETLNSVLPGFIAQIKKNGGEITSSGLPNSQGIAENNWEQNLRKLWTSIMTS